jgi:hypothetical protein
MRNRDRDRRGERRSRRGGCYFCSGGEGDRRYDFYAGFVVAEKETRALFSNTVRFRGEYRDMKRLSVGVCDACEARIRRRRHLPWVIGYGVVFVVCGIGAAWVHLSQGAAAWGGTAAFGFFAGLGALMAALEAWGLVSPGTSGEVTTEILRQVKHDRSFRDQGDRFFGPEEYRVLFGEDQDVPTSAAEIIARGDPDRSERRRREERDPEDDLTVDELIARGEPERRRKPRPRREEETKSCPHCGGEIPAYAEACRHCKKILG